MNTKKNLKLSVNRLHLSTSSSQILLNPLSEWFQLKPSRHKEKSSKYGFLRRDYLKNHRNSTYQVMLLQDTIGEHLLEVDKAAREREKVILKQLEEKEPLPDKEKDQMAWVRAANQRRAIAEEIILKELIYV